MILHFHTIALGTRRQHRRQTSLLKAAFICPHNRLVVDRRETSDHPHASRHRTRQSDYSPPPPPDSCSHFLLISRLSAGDNMRSRNTCAIRQTARALACLLCTSKTQIDSADSMLRNHVVADVCMWWEGAFILEQSNRRPNGSSIKQSQKCAHFPSTADI